MTQEANLTAITWLQCTVLWVEDDTCRFDLRNLDSRDLHEMNKGSTWLIGKDELKDIIKETHYENLFIIPAGPVPPNSSELLALKKTKELLDLLKERYECIIIDSSPIGAVSDAYFLLPMADLPF